MRYWIPYIIILVAWAGLLACDRMAQVDDHYEASSHVYFDTHVPDDDPYLEESSLYEDTLTTIIMLNGEETLIIMESKVMPDYEVCQLCEQRAKEGNAKQKRLR